MKQILAISLFALLAVATTYGQPRGTAQPPRMERHARFADSAVIYYNLWYKSQFVTHKRDSADYYMSRMNSYRLMESHRQWLYDDSGWRSELHRKQNGWTPYHQSGKQDFHKIIGAINSLYFHLFFAGPKHAYWEAPGEYVPMLLDETTNIAYSYTNTGVPATVPNMPANVVFPVGGPHNGAALTRVGGLWMYGGWTLNGAAYTSSGSSSMINIPADSLGLPLDPVVYAILSGNSTQTGSQGNFWNMFFTTSTGKLYGGGNLSQGCEGNGTYGNLWSSKPVRINATGNPFFTKVQAGYFVIAMDSSGAVWTWGGNGGSQWLGQGPSPTWMVPTKISLPPGRRAVDIASNGQICSTILLDDGEVYACGLQFYEEYVGAPSGSFNNSLFHNISQYWNPYLNPGHKLVHVNASSNMMYAVQDNGYLFDVGCSPCGEAGVGLMLNFSLAANGPYFWGFNPHQVPTGHLYRVAPGLSFKAVHTCSSNSFYFCAEDSAGRPSGSGRDKGQAMLVPIVYDSTHVIANANYVTGLQGAGKPDSWNLGYLTAFDPGSITANQPIASPYCILNPTDGANGCTGFTNPVFQPVGGSLAATAIGNTIVLNASGKTCANPITQILWYEDTIRSPSKVDMKYGTAVKDTITSVKDTGKPAAGIYYFYARLITSHADTVTDSIHIVINGQGPIVSAGPNQTIYTPATSAQLVGTATGQGGATIIGYSWTQLPGGPNTANIATFNQASTAVTGLIPGVYTFQLTATDSNNNQTSATVTVTVNLLNGLSVPYPLLIPT